MFKSKNINRWNTGMKPDYLPWISQNLFLIFNVPVTYKVNAAPLSSDLEPFKMTMLLFFNLTDSLSASVCACQRSSCRNTADSVNISSLKYWVGKQAKENETSQFSNSLQIVFKMVSVATFTCRLISKWWFSTSEAGEQPYQPSRLQYWQQLGITRTVFL